MTTDVKLIERLRQYEAGGYGEWSRAAGEAAAALEAAREDACVALVADIRFACGDNGKRMQPELVEFIRELAADAERLDWMADQMRITELHDILGSVPLEPCDLRTAIDQARGKGGGE